MYLKEEETKMRREEQKGKQNIHEQREIFYTELFSDV
jgi:hypothetical protein